MARPGVTYFDIANAAETIKAQGQEPTVDRVREQLGTGSKSTIAPLLKRWRTENEDTPEVHGLPNDLLDVVKSLYQRVQDMADQRIEEARQSFQEEKDELLQSLTAAQQRIAQLTAQEKTLEEQIGQLSRDKHQQAQVLESTRLELVKSESHLGETSNRVAELKDTIVELKQENKDIREHFDHYQQRIAADRQIEREQFHTTSRQQQDELQTLRHQFTAAQAKIDQLQDANLELLEQQDTLKDSNQSLELELKQALATSQGLARELETAHSMSLSQQRQQEELNQALTRMSQQLSEAEKERALMSLQWDTTKTEAESLKNQILTVTEENRLLLQQKAEIQGQYKQLQNSR